MTENLDQNGTEIGGAKIGVGKWDKKTEYRVFIGTNVTLAAGITICPGAIIGSKANVRKSITVPGVYVGNPARIVRSVKIVKGKNVIIERSAEVGAQPYLFHGGKIVVPEMGVVFGNDVWVGCGAIIMSGSERPTYLGNNVKVAQFSNVGHDSILNDGVMISAGVTLGGFSEIGRGTYIGMGVTVRNRIKVGEFSFIGQNSNVVKDIPDNVVAFGNPCRVQKRRSGYIAYLLKRLFK